MARTVAGLPEGSRLSDFITLGVLAETFPARKIHEVLRETGRESERQRRLPAHVMVYYVIALALYMEVSYGEVLRCLVEGLKWLGQPVKHLRQTSRVGISKARTRLGFEPMQRLYDELVHPIATERTRGAFYHSAAQDRSWRLVSLDGSTLDIPDEEANAAVFGRPPSSRGQSAYPKLRFVSLAECGTHVLFASSEGAYREGEIELARKVLPKLRSGMLCIADRYFFGYPLWREATATGSDLLWRVRNNIVLPRLDAFTDGSYLSAIYASPTERRNERNGIAVRVIEYTLESKETSQSKATIYRVITSILDPEAAPARDLAALYHERWEIESAFDELKTHLRGRRVVLRSKTPDLVRQEFYGLLLAHYAVRALMHEAALAADIDPDNVSFVHSVRVVRRKIQTARGLGEAGSGDLASPFSPSTNGPSA